MLALSRNKRHKSSVLPEKTDCLSFDEFLPHIGGFGLYQKSLLVYVIPFFFIFAFIYMTHIFLIIVPNDHWCRIQELQDLSKNEQRELGIPKTDKNEYDKCHMYDTNYTEALHKNITTADTSWPKIPCKEWVYDKKQVPYDTIATQYNWVCKDNDLGSYSVTIYFMGSIIGGLLLGYITDHWGRIPAVMLSNSLALVGGILSAFSRSFAWFSISRFMVGIAYDNCCIPVYVLIMECVSSKYRAAITNYTLTLCFVPAACLLPFIALWCNDWRLLSIVTTVPIIICLLMYFLLHESPRWLISVGKVDKAMPILKHISKVNSKIISDAEMELFRKCSILAYNEEQISKHYTLMDLFKSYRLCVLIVDLIIIWMITDLVYDAQVRIIVEIGPDPFITFSLANAVEVPACIIPLFFLDYIGRKCMSFTAFLGCAAGSIIAGLLKTKWQIALSAIFSRFCVTIVYNVGTQWAAEILPTVVRGQGIALIHIMGFVSSLLSPFVLYTKHYFSWAPMSIIASLSICAAFLVIILPETTRIDLPQTPADTEELSKTQFPCH